MKTIINELTVMIQERAEKINNTNIRCDAILIDCLNREIDVLNIAIKAIQSEENIDQMAVHNRNAFRKWQIERE